MTRTYVTSVGQRQIGVEEASNRATGRLPPLEVARKRGIRCPEFAPHVAVCTRSSVARGDAHSLEASLIRSASLDQSAIAIHHEPEIVAADPLVPRPRTPARPGHASTATPASRTAARPRRRRRLFRRRSFHLRPPANCRAFPRRYRPCLPRCRRVSYDSNSPRVTCHPRSNRPPTPAPNPSRSPFKVSMSARA